MKDIPHTIVFYDGVCGVCNKFVQWVLKKDKQNIIFFCSLQSNTAKQILAPYNVVNTPEYLTTLYLLNSNTLFKKSKAIINICKILNYNVLLTALLDLIPRFISDFFYDVFASKRYLLTVSNACLMPTSNIKKQFIQ
jgi:predicted DCC family thiol-disulfide oxidoreductase YuxK